MTKKNNISILVANDTPLISTEELATSCAKKHSSFIKAVDIFLESLPSAKEHILEAKSFELGSGYLLDLQGFVAIAPYISSDNKWTMDITEAFNKASRQIINEKHEKATEHLRQANRSLKEERDEAKEKAEALDALCNSSDYYSFSDAAKLLGVKRKDFIRAMEEHEYIIRRMRRGRYNQTTLIPREQYMVGSGEGLFVLKQIKYGPTWKNGEGKICQSATMWPYLTEKGLVKMRILLKRWGCLAA